jgi:hypothetical protein
MSGNLNFDYFVRQRRRRKAEPNKKAAENFSFPLLYNKTRKI